MYVEKVPWEVNYDEAEIPPYSLPDLLPPGIDSAEKWEKIRRPELLRLFEEVMYGELPPMPDRVRYELLCEKTDALGGRALRREVRLHFEMNGGRSHFADMLCYIPAERSAPAPVFVGLTFVGNHVVTAEPDVRITGLAYDDGAHELDRTRGVQVRRFPLETILGRGYAVAVASYHDFFPDRIDGWEQSIYRLFYSGDALKRVPGHSSIGAWAWGLSRMLDSCAAMPEIDGTRAAVFGHSRLGKTSLWAGVTDPRFKVVCVNDSGCGGAALSRRLYGETLFSMCNRTISATSGSPTRWPRRPDTRKNCPSTSTSLSRSSRRARSPSTARPRTSGRTRPGNTSPRTTPGRSGNCTARHRSLRRRRPRPTARSVRT